MTAREDGGIAIVSAVTAMLLSVAALGLTSAVLDYGVAAARARTAADAAALAAMSASPLAAGTGTPGPRADVVAEANGARVRRIDDDAWPLRVRVVVEVMPRSRAVSALTGAVEATATAQVRPRP